MTIAQKLIGLQRGFNPLSLSGLEAWYDASDASTLYTDLGTTLVSADAQSIEQWNDKSGNARHLTQTSAAARPTYKTGIQNGKSIARFDGGDFMTKILSGLTSAGDYAQFIVLKPANTGAVNQYVFDPFDGGSQTIIWGFEDQMLEAYDLPRVNMASSDTTAFLVAEVVDDNATRTGRKNGTQTEQSASVGGGDASTGVIALGGTNAGGSLFVGDIAELLYLSAAPSAEQVTGLRGYLGTKYGITVA